MIGSNIAGTPSAPSLTVQEVYQLYQKYLHRDPDATELASELDNATRYSALGIERQIANRSDNTAGSGIRGDEGLPSLSVAPPLPADNHVGNAITLGPAAIQPGPSSTGPTGTIPAQYGGGGSAIAPQYYGASSSGTIFGLSPVALVLLLAAAGAAYYFVRKG